MKGTAICANIWEGSKCGGEKMRGKAEMTGQSRKQELASVAGRRVSKG